MRLSFFTLFIVSFLFSIEAKAWTCDWHRKENIERDAFKNAGVIFEGVALETVQNKSNNELSYTIFEVSKLYKGEKKVNHHIYHHTAYRGDRWHRSFEIGRLYLIYAEKKEIDNRLVVDGCSFVYELRTDKAKEAHYFANILYLRKYQSEKNILEELSKQEQHEGYLVEKEKLLWDHNDFFNLVPVYENILGAIYKDQSLNRDPLAGFVGTLENGICTNAKDFENLNPELIRNLKPLNGAAKYEGFLYRYAYTLYQIGRYQEAVLPICLVQSQNEKVKILRENIFTNLSEKD